MTTTHARVIAARGIAALAFCVLVGLPSAQAEAQALRAGSLVRVHRADPPPLTGRVDRFSTDSLWLRSAHAARPIDVGAIHRLELRQRLPRGRNGARWAVRGLLAGAAIGGVTCLADQEQCLSGLGPGDGLTEGFLAATMMAGGAGAFIGFVAGAALPGHRWVEISPPWPALP